MLAALADETNLDRCPAEIPMAMLRAIPTDSTTASEDMGRAEDLYDIPELAHDVRTGEQMVWV